MKKILLPEEKENKTESLIYKIVKLITVCLSIFNLLLLAFYIVGNYQNFQDSSQEIILTSLLYSSILNFLLSIPVIIENIFMIFTRQNIKGGIISLILMILNMIFNLACVVISAVISFLASGFN